MKTLKLTVILTLTILMSASSFADCKSDFGRFISQNSPACYAVFNNNMSKINSCARDAKKFGFSVAEDAYNICKSCGGGSSCVNAIDSIIMSDGDPSAIQSALQILNRLSSVENNNIIPASYDYRDQQQESTYIEL